MYARLSHEVKAQRTSSGSLSLSLPGNSSPQLWIEPLRKLASSLSIVSGNGIRNGTYDPAKVVVAKLPQIKRAYATMMKRELLASLEVGIQAATPDAPTIEEPEPPDLEEEDFELAARWLRQSLRLAGAWAAAGDDRDPEDVTLLYLRAVALQQLDAIEGELGTASGARANEARTAVAAVLAKTECNDMAALEKEKVVKMVPRGCRASAWEDRVAEKTARHARREREVAVLKGAVERIEACVDERLAAEEDGAAEEPGAGGGKGGKKRAAPAPKGKAKAKAKKARGKGKAKAKAGAAASAASAASQDDDDDEEEVVVEPDVPKYYGTKMTALRELLAGRFSAPGCSGKAVVFSSYPDMLKLAQRSLKAAGIASVCPKDLVREDRNKALLDFSTADSAVSVMLLTLDHTQVSGLTLTAADTVVLLNPSLDKGIEQQAIGRCHRIGQTRPVHVYQVLAGGTVEEDVARLRDAAAAGDRAAGQTTLRVDELKEVFGVE